MNAVAEPEALIGPYMVEVERLRNVLDPFEDDVWGTGVLTREAVAKAIAEGRLEARPSEIWGSRYSPTYHSRPVSFDAERVAYLVLNPATDPIAIEVLDTWGSTRFEDGCHRLAAAIFRNDTHILTDFGGYVDAFFKRFIGPPPRF